MRLFTLLLFLSISCTYGLLAQDSIPLPEKDLSELSIEELMNLTVYSASKKQERLNDAPSIVTVITKNDLLYYGGFTLIDALKYVPSLEVSLGSDGFYRVSIRGSRKEGNILFLIDDKPVNDFYNGRALFDIPISIVDRVEIIRGPGSALFGTNAVVGVINVKTSRNNNVCAAASAHGGAVASGNFLLERKETTANFSASFVHNSVPKVRIEQDKEFDQPWSETYASKNYLADRWNNDLVVNTGIKILDFSMDLYGIYRQQGAYVGPIFTAAPDSKLSTGQLAFKSMYDIKISDNVIITPKVYFNMNHHDFLSQEVPDNYLSSQSGDLFTEGKLTREKYNGYTYGAQLDFLIKASKNIEILTGSIFEDQVLRDYSVYRNYKITSDEYFSDFGNYDNINFDQNNERRFVFAYFLQTKFNYKKWNLTSGLRFDEYSDFGQSFNPRLGINYQIFKNLSVKGLVGKAFRAPTFLELYDNTTLGNEHGVKGNIDLSPEIITTYELAAEYVRRIFVARYNVFFMDNRNLIRIYDPHGGGSIGVYENIGDVATYGHEFEITIRIAQPLQFYCNFSQYISYFEWSEDKINQSDIVFYSKQPQYNKELRNIPTIRANSGLKFNYGKWRLFAGANFGNPSQNNKRFYLEKDNDIEIPYYVVGNFSAAYQITSKLITQLSALNIGVKYSDPDESTNIDAFGDLGLRQPGLILNFSLKYEF